MDMQPIRPRSKAEMPLTRADYLACALLLLAGTGAVLLVFAVLGAL